MLTTDHQLPISLLIGSVEERPLIMTDGTAVPTVVPVTEYTGVLRRWGRVILTVVVAGAALGGLLLALRPAVYVSEALVQIRPVVARNDDPDPDLGRLIDPATEVAVARSQRVAEQAHARRLAAADLGAPLDAPEVVAMAADLVATDAVDADDVRLDMEQVSVRTLGDTDIITFEARAGDADRSQALAQSTALSYLTFRREAAESSTAEARTRLQEREAQLVAELDDLADLIGAAGGDEAEVRALAYAEVAKRQELTVIGSSFGGLQALTVDPGLVLTDAAVPTGPEGLPLLAGPVTGALLGLIAAVAGAFLLDRTDDRIRSGRVELGALGVPLLGTAPPARTEVAGPGGSRLHPVNSAAGDAYRRLQGTVLFNLDRGNKSAVLVTGVRSAQPSTSVAANVAASAARAGRSTLLIGADLRNGQLAKHVGLPPGEAGLSDVILDGVSLSLSIVDVDGIENLSFLGAGTRLDRPAHVLQSESFARLMAAVQTDYDLVVVESPPVLKVADAVDIAGLCDGTIVVAQSRDDGRAAIADTVDQLRNVGADVVGVVVAEDR